MKLPLAQIFELQGERYFRRVERQVLGRLLESVDGGVIATGGGIEGGADTPFPAAHGCRPTAPTLDQPAQKMTGVYRQPEIRAAPRLPGQSVNDRARDLTGIGQVAGQPPDSPLQFRPLPCRRITGSIAFVMRTTPKKLTSNIS